MYKPKTGRPEEIAIVLIVFFLMAFVPLSAQMVYETDHRHRADLVVYVEDHAHRADLQVHKEAYRHRAGDNNGRWYFTEYRHRADYTVYFTDSRHRADLTIYYVDNAHRAGWKNGEKRALMVESCERQISGNIRFSSLWCSIG